MSHTQVLTRTLYTPRAGSLPFSRLLSACSIGASVRIAQQLEPLRQRLLRGGRGRGRPGLCALLRAHRGEQRLHHGGSVGPPPQQLRPTKRRRPATGLARRGSSPDLSTGSWGGRRAEAHGHIPALRIRDEPLSCTGEAGEWRVGEGGRGRRRGRGRARRLRSVAWCGRRRMRVRHCRVVHGGSARRRRGSGGRAARRRGQRQRASG